MPISTPTGTVWQVATDSDFTDIIVDDVGGYSLTRDFVQDELPYGVDLYIRARHVHPTAGATEWSNPVQFQVKNQGWVIGICLDNSNELAKGQFYWIDANGNKLDSFDYQSHPTYAGVEMAVLDAECAPVTMTKFPQFYIKTAVSGPTGSFADGMKCWWICDKEIDGFRPHPVFMANSTTYASHVYVGTYLAHIEYIDDDTPTLGSKAGQQANTATEISEVISTAYRGNINRNTDDGDTTIVIYNVYHLNMLRWLALIAKASTDVENVWGTNEENIANPLTGSTNAKIVFKGTQENPDVFIDDMWRCGLTYTNLMNYTANTTTDTLVLYVAGRSFEYNSDTLFAQLTLNMTGGGYFKDVASGTPENLNAVIYDLMEMFWPAEFVDDEQFATFGYITATPNARVGYNYRAYSGSPSLCANIPTNVFAIPSDSCNGLFSYMLSTGTITTDSAGNYTYFRISAW